MKLPVGADDDLIRAEINQSYHVPNRPFFDRLEIKGGGDAVSAARAVLQTGDTLTITAGPTTAEGYTWYRATTQAGSSGWIAGELYDYFGFYAPAFAAGVAANAINLAIVGALVLRQRQSRNQPAGAG